MLLSQSQRQAAIDHCRNVQNELVRALERVDGTSSFERKTWSRPAPAGSGSIDPGGGTMAVLRGPVVEKAGANISVIQGDKYPALEGEHKDKPFFVTGISTICHMYNPHAPIAHMNVRLLEVGDTFWVGGGADLTPFIAYEEDTLAFHQAMRQACAKQTAGTYERLRAWCDEYFFIPHRQSCRGVGGIFFDYMQGEFTQLLDFIKAVTAAYVDVYPTILARRRDMPFTAAQKEEQLYWRGRYAEFNLAYDRGTKFGLMTGGNTEAIFVSLPPVVKW